MRIEFFVHWVVRPKQSVRHRIVRPGKGAPFVQSYQPAALRQNEAELIATMQQHRPSKPLSGPIAAIYEFHYPWRSNEPQKNKARGCIPKTTRPDLGQLDKQIEDCLERGGLIANDSMIWRRTSSRFWSGQQGVRIRLEEIDH